MCLIIDFVMVAISEEPGIIYADRGTDLVSVDHNIPDPLMT